MRNLVFPLLMLSLVPAMAGAQTTTIRDRVLAEGVSEEVILVEYPALPLRTLTSSAGAIVHVSIRSRDTFLSSDGAAIVTDYRATVVDVVKGDPSARVSAGDVITIRRAGGELQVEGRTVFSNESGFPPFARGGEYVLFLKTGGGQPYEMLAGAQSAFRVDRGAVTPVTDAGNSAAAVLMPLFLHDVRAQR